MTVQEILVESQSENVAEAIEKLDKTLSAIEGGHEGPLAGVYPWESQSEAAKRIDNELSILAEAFLKSYDSEEPTRKS